MMATTHALAGVLLAVALDAVVPGAGGGLPLLAAGVGGLFPDLDLLWSHRRTLHFPIYYPVAAVAAAAAAVAFPGPVTVAAALFLAAAALHSVSDTLGGGLELRPWEGRSDRAVYDHHRDRWLAPRRVVRYDGAPEDLLVATALAAPSLLLLDGAARLAVVATLSISAVYVLFRRRLVDAAEAAVRGLPDAVVDRLPEGLIEDLR